MNPIAEDILMHYGIPRRSGRYPWGSGDDPYQHGSRDFIGRVEELRKNGFTYIDEDGKKWTGDNAIAKSMGLTSTQFRTEYAVAKDERRMLQVTTAKSLQQDGLGATEIGRKMGINESTVRSLLNDKSESRMNQARKTADFIKEQVDKKGMVDVGLGVETELNISSEKLNQALYLLEREGYPVYGGRFSQVTNKGSNTTQRVICKPGTEHKEIYDLENVHSLNDYVSHDGGETFDKFVYPKSISSSRVKVLLKDEIGPDGEPGVAKDGLIQIRRGVPDLSLGNDHYSQVRILVDDDKYLKGMAIYSDNMPDGVDIIFNSNKPSVEKAYKKIKDDPENPFGSLIKAGGQSYYTDENGNRQLSAINKRAGEGDWSEWKDKLPSQFLSKQSISLAKEQLGIAIEDKKAEYDDIMALNNPTIKKHLLNKFAEECDSAAVHLQAAALPGQKYHVIIPINSLKDDEIYAPNYENGTKLALIRYPHEGTYQIPILTVNNKHAQAKQLLGHDIEDAVGINSKNAERLSGADFDGDTVMCIPTHDKYGKVKILSTPQLKGLKDFDSKQYQYSDEELANGNCRIMRNTQKEMGVISNLICDMTLKGAKPDELAAATRHSMVVIDAEKHKLNYKQSEIDNNIKALKEKYQNGGGASTLISRSKGELTIDKRQGAPKVNLKGKDWYDPDKPEGSLIYKTADDLYYQDRYATDSKKGLFKKGDLKYNPDGSPKMVKRTQASTRMAETNDARTLISEENTPMERLYADYANTMKNMANKARVDVANTDKIAYSKQAAKTYKEEVNSLKNKLDNAIINHPKEREAQRRANVEIDEKIKAYKNEHGENMSKGDIKKASQQAITKYRNEVGTVNRRKRNIEITDKEWESIQAGAVSENILKNILQNTDTDSLRQRATPKTSNKLSSDSISRIKTLSNQGYTNAEIAKKIGVSSSSVSKYLKGAS